MARWLIYRADPIGEVEARDRSEALALAIALHPRSEVKVRSKVAAELAAEDDRLLRKQRRLPNIWTNHKRED
jgi:hypothetical protein